MAWREGGPGGGLNWVASGFQYAKKERSPLP